jgi:hypothetical protein
MIGRMIDINYDDIDPRKTHKALRLQSGISRSTSAPSGASSTRAERPDPDWPLSWALPSRHSALRASHPRVQPHFGFGPATEPTGLCPFGAHLVSFRLTQLGPWDKFG